MQSTSWTSPTSSCASASSSSATAPSSRSKNTSTRSPRSPRGHRAVSSRWAPTSQAALLLATVGLAEACAPPTCDEVEGAICEDELAELLADDTGAAEGWAWFDAEGRQVTIDAELLWEDEDGVIWQVEPRTAELEPLEADPRTAGLWYEGDDCTGTAWAIFTPEPRWAYAVDGYDQVWVASAQSSWESVTVRGFVAVGGEGCAPGLYEDIVAITWEQVDEVNLPADPGWSAPLTLQAW